MTATGTPVRVPANPDDAALAEAMAVEEQYIAARRPSAGGAPSQVRTGLALSGGGIRSATFSLGILQALSRAGLLPQLDYLSTVSGGSYIGSFFGALYVPPERRGDKPLPEDGAATFVERPLQSARGRKAVAGLREFGRYLTPGGASDTMYGISLVTRNWVSLQVVLGLVPLFFFLTIRLLDAACLLGIPSLKIPISFRPSGMWPPARLWDAIGRMALPPSQPLSVSFALFTLLGVLLSCSTAISYWFSRRESVPANPAVRLITNAPFVIAVVLSLGGIATLIADLATPSDVWQSELACLIGSKNEPCARDIPLGKLAIVFVLGWSTLFYVWALYAERRAQAEMHGGMLAIPADEEENVRGRLTRRLANIMLATLVLGAATMVDYLGGRLEEATLHVGENSDAVVRSLYRAQAFGGIGLAWRFFWPFLALAAPALLTVWAHGSLRRGSGPGWLTKPSGQAALGLSILFFWMVIWAAISRALDDKSLLIAWGVNLAWIVIVSFCYGFLNQSSLVSLYASRLKRAYVGASNPSDADRGYDIGRDGDTIGMSAYYGTPEDGSLALKRPVHLINLTIAQTQPDGPSHVVAYDRKGKPMHVSPAGLIYESGGVGQSERKPFEEGEQLSLSTWTAISGAAASTAIGSMTSLGLSILALMANVRLGYWWKSNTSSWYKAVALRDTVLGYLLSELQSSFATDEKQQRWYLSDGGHFENTGAYALIQRRLDFIVVCDNGADPDYQLDDVVRLIDRARADLKAEIRFLGADYLDTLLGADRALRECFGTYAELASPPPASELDRRGKAMPYAALARITYDIDERDLNAPASATGVAAPAQGLLMLVKPRLNFTEPPELLAYQQREAGATFPQQTTLDQFFDEEQWEAYRRFGEIIGESLFKTSTVSWSPGGVLQGSFPPISPTALEIATAAAARQTGGAKPHG